jgi:hypothetical protein
MHQQDEPSEVRKLSHNVEVRARAEEAMRQMMAKPPGKRRGRRQSDTSRWAAILADRRQSEVKELLDL